MYSKFRATRALICINGSDNIMQIFPELFGMLGKGKKRREYAESTSSDRRPITPQHI